jgi:outer membrane protein TolC
VPFLAAIFVFLTMIYRTATLAAQELPDPSPAAPEVPAATRITLDEAKERALAASKLLNLATLNAESKAYAIKAARADYFPKVMGNVFYFHFNDNLGNVLTVQGRTLTLSSGIPLLSFPTTSIDSAVFQQNSSFAAFYFGCIPRSDRP